MSATAGGFVPGSGAGALLLEDLESALARKVTIYGELLGGEVNSGGQRGTGSMTAPNADAVRRCIIEALKNSGVSALEVDAINGHLTATTKDAFEIENWIEALGRRGKDFPFINSLKGMTGHCLSAAGSIESVATVLQLYHGFIFGNSNCVDLHPEIAALIDPSNVPMHTRSFAPQIIAKASFGFGDVNACLIFKKFDNLTYE